MGDDETAMKLIGPLGTDDFSVNIPAPMYDPPVENIVTQKGYESTGLKKSEPAPPPAQEDHGISEELVNIDIPEPKCTSDEAREALLKFVKQNVCWGNCAAKSMTFENMAHTPAMDYKLVTFAEKRTTAYEQVPYNGEILDGPENGDPPQPWDIPVHPPNNFDERKDKIEVPHTAYVKGCHVCFSSGRIRCDSCSGAGRSRCAACQGVGNVERYRDGETINERCGNCNGAGARICNTCNGIGTVTCSKCEGATRLKWFIELTVKFKNYKDHHVSEKTGVPDKILIKAKSSELFCDEKSRLKPITTFPVDVVNENSAVLVKKHEKYFETRRVHMQRHSVSCVPVTQCDVNYSGTDFTFWVYGDDHRAHVPDYPQTCWCCKCAIL